MRIQSEFKTKQEAIAYLEQRGWRVIGTVLGDVQMINEGIPNRVNRICRLPRTGSWKIERA